MDPTAGTAEGVRTLGTTLRQRRLERGLTLVRLAEAAGLSHPFLSQLERGLARPSMTSLERIADALGSSVVELLATGEGRREAVDSHVLRHDDGPVGPYGLGTARMLGPALLTFVPMACEGANVDDGPLHRHVEDEFLTVVDGRILLDLGEERHGLGPGDSATIAGGTPHRWRSPDGSVYRLVIVKEGAGVARMRDDLGSAAGVLEDWSR